LRYRLTRNRVVFLRDKSDVDNVTCGVHNSASDKAKQHNQQLKE
jgi:hypothetical protein